MMDERQSYEIPYPSSRQLTCDLGRIGLAKHHVKALLEVDVTEAEGSSSRVSIPLRRSCLLPADKSDR